MASLCLLPPRACARSWDMESASGQHKCLNEAEPFTGYMRCRRCFPSVSRPQQDQIVVRMPRQARFDMMYDHFFGDEYRDVYDIASETKETKSQHEMVQLLTSIPSPWHRSCTACKSSSGNLIACAYIIRKHVHHGMQRSLFQQGSLRINRTSPPPTISLFTRLDDSCGGLHQVFSDMHV
jgi:hypothetical protein